MTTTAVFTAGIATGAALTLLGLYRLLDKNLVVG